MLHKFSWVVVALSTIVGGISAALLLSDGPQPFKTLKTVVGVTSVLAIPLLILQARRDMHEVCVYLAIFGSITAFISGAIIHGTEEINYIVVTVAVLATVSVIYSFVYLIREKFITDDIPNVLIEKFGKERIFEAEGVQFVVDHNGESVKAGDFFEIELYLQNCFDNELTMCVSLDNSRKNRKRMEYPTESEFIVPGGAVISVVIPVKVNVDAKKKFSLTAGFRVKGSGNKRIRRWRAATHTPPTTGGLQAFALLGGVLISGGGMKLKGQIIPAETTKEYGETREIESELIVNVPSFVK